MPIRKKGDVEIQASANGTKVKQTGYTFYSYDKNAAALYFQFRGQDGQPTDLGKATIHLVMILNDDDGKEFIPKSDEIKVISAIRGTAKYVLPEMLLSYSGKVTGYVYMDFDDGSQTDEGQFTFRIRRSMITHVLPEAGDKYVQDFEDVKERVEQAGDSATKDIEKAKDDAESQIGDYAGEVESAKDSTIEDIDKALPEVVESAKQDISSSASDVQSKASEASEDISGLVKSTEDARDNAESQIGDYVGEVESAKDSTIEDIDKALPEVEDKLDEVAGKISELDISDTNLLKGTSDKWDKVTINAWGIDLFDNYYLYLSDLKISAGDTLTLSALFDNTVDDKQNEIFIKFKAFDDTNTLMKTGSENKIQMGSIGKSTSTITVPEGTTKLRAYAFRDGSEGSKTVGFCETKLQRGKYATDWKPNPSEIVTQDQYDKLAKAIINLGGSI